MSPFPTFLDRRRELEQMVADRLATYADGYIAPPDGSETQSLDFKEEAGRRSRGVVLPGEPTNNEAAEKLADEVACMANSPGGGALVVGVEDKTGRLLGTELDVEWLRNRINSAVSVAPDIREEHVGGHRLLAIYVAEANEPVANSSDQLRWRVADSCVAVDRSEWWEQKSRREGRDQMLQPSGWGPSDVRPGAMQLVRDWLDADPTEGDTSLLRRIGALHSGGQLTHAGALCLAPVGRTALEYTGFDVQAGSVTAHERPDPGLSLLEQLDQVESVVRGVNTMVTVEAGLRHEQIRRIPAAVVREALLNGVIHRDWNRHEPTEVRWTELDSELVVRSPGGFPGGITRGNILSNREARYPALADLFRALGLVDKQGVGVDRMYREMIVLGHRPPEIEEVDGPYVECVVRGGEPVYPVLSCVRAITPAERQNDARVAIILYQLLHSAFVTEDRVAEVLQETAEAARSALEVARQTVVGGSALIRRFKGAWILGDPARKILRDAFDAESAFPLMAYTSTDADRQGEVALRWIGFAGKVTTGDLHELAGIARGTAKKALDTLVDEGRLMPVGQGRSSGYVLPS